jgi:hypothetical protein
MLVYLKRIITNNTFLSKNCKIGIKIELPLILLYVIYGRPHR